MELSGIEKHWLEVDQKSRLEHIRLSTQRMKAAREEYSDIVKRIALELDRLYRLGYSLQPIDTSSCQSIIQQQANATRNAGSLGALMGYQLGGVF